MDSTHTGNTSDAINDILDHLLANGVVTTSIVVGSILLSINQKLGVEERAVTTGSDLVDGGRVQVDEEGAGHVFTTAGLGEEGLVRTTVKDILRVGIGTAVMTKTMLKKVPGGRWLDIKKYEEEDTDGGIATYSSQALLPSWVPAWPR